MRHKEFFLSILMLVSIGITQIQAISSVFQILPKPQYIEELRGKGISGTDLQFIVNQSSGEMPVLGPILNALPQVEMQGKGVYLTITDKDVPESEEGYVLSVNEKGVVIAARSEAGLFYGCQTLEQVLEDSRDYNCPIPAMKITDFPSIAYRAVHLDTKHHLDRMEYYYAMMDKLARYKINAVIWELEDKLRYTRRPEIASPNAISKQEMQALCRYAKERNIDVSPLVQGLGHASFILKHHWELRENPKSDWELCPSNPETYDLLYDLYADALEAMPYGKYLHIGGDEITAIGIDKRCKDTGKTAFELQMYWLQNVCNYAKEKGRVPIFWDDMPLKYAGLWTTILSDMSGEELDKAWNTEKLDQAIELFPKDCIYMRWNYGDATKPAHMKLLNWYKEKGLQVMAATAASSGDSPFLPRNNTKAGFIQGFSRLVVENHLAGILATAWDDGSPHLETVWRGYIAQGEFGWNPTGRTIDEFMEAHGQREFGFKAGENRMDFLKELEEAFFFFDGALVESGRRNPAWGTTTFTLIDLPDQEKPGEWAEKYKEKIIQAEKESLRFEKIRKQLTDSRKMARRNRYTLEVYEQNNYLQNYPVRLILALRDYDLATHEQQREEAQMKLAEVCSSFSSMRTRLEEVYSKTRFMEQPAGYIEDMNHHNHLSAKSQNSDWLFLYELPMVEKVQKWLNSKTIK